MAAIAKNLSEKVLFHSNEKLLSQLSNESSSDENVLRILLPIALLNSALIIFADPTPYRMILSLIHTRMVV